MKTAAMAILIAFLCCACSRSTPKGAIAASDELSQVSPTVIGKQITIRGQFSLLGKIGPYVLLDSQQAVYLVSRGSFTWGKPYSEMEGKLVAATGTLRFFHAPDAKPADSRAIARPPDYFYFEGETAQVRLIDH
jgi:hypothetical protein